MEVDMSNTCRVSSYLSTQMWSECYSS